MTLLVDQLLLKFHEDANTVQIVCDIHGIISYQ